ncbi:MAG: hypothetical protein AAF658_16065, partial [Myxococcota bacterium]
MNRLEALERRLPRDPRLLQIAILSSLVFYGIFVLEFGVPLRRLLLTVTAALACQWVCTWAVALITRLRGSTSPVRFDPKSAFITSLSLTLLLRVPHDGWAVAAAAMAITSKFVIRFRGKHIFNPANIAIVVCLLLGTGWVAPGQWGSFALFGLILGGCGI